MRIPDQAVDDLRGMTALQIKRMRGTRVGPWLVQWRNDIHCNPLDGKVKFRKDDKAERGRKML